MPAWEGERDVTDLGWPGAGPFHYTILSEPHLSTELARAAQSTSEIIFGTKIDSVGFQPCLVEDERSQDRKFATSTKFGLLVGILDGHGGHETADFVLKALPNLITSSLSAAETSSLTPSEVSSLLSDAILSVDANITNDIISLVSGGAEGLSRRSEEDVDEIVSKNHDVLLKGMRGTTALVALVDASKENLWIANVGDCVAVLATKGSDESWTGEILNISHNAVVESEAQRIRKEHPGEDAVIARDRVLSAIAVTRAIGDQTFKLPSIYTARLFLSPKAPAYRTHTPVGRVILPQIRTPPYLTAEPDVRHVALSPLSSHYLTSGKEQADTAPTTPRRVLIMCSDGLPSLALHHDTTFDRRKMDPATAREARESVEKEATNMWVRVVGRCVDATSAGEGQVTGNLALEVLKAALAGEGQPGPFRAEVIEEKADRGKEDSEKKEREKRVSRLLTVEMMEKWMDDTTVSVIYL